MLGGKISNKNHPFDCDGCMNNKLYQVGISMSNTMLSVRIVSYSVQMPFSLALPKKICPIVPTISFHDERFAFC